MNYFSSTKDIPVINNFLMLFTRIFIGISMIFLHGLPKLEKLQLGGDIKFYSFLGMGAETTLIIAVLLEIIGAFLIIMGLFTRVTSLILIMAMAIAAFGVHAADPFSIMELSLLYLTVFMLIFAFGPRKFSIDSMIAKRRESKW